MYWKGVMSWPIDTDWKCETCGQEFSILFGGLTWGLANGVCRCDKCHTQYKMRDSDIIVTTPACLLKDEYKDPAKALWGKYQIPISEFTDSDWDGAIKALAE